MRNMRESFELMERCPIHQTVRLKRCRANVNNKQNYQLNASSSIVGVRRTGKFPVGTFTVHFSWEVLGEKFLPRSSRFNLISALMQNVRVVRFGRRLEINSESLRSRLEFRRAETFTCNSANVWTDHYARCLRSSSKMNGNAVAVITCSWWSSPARISFWIISNHFEIILESFRNHLVFKPASASAWSFWPDTVNGARWFCTACYRNVSLIEF